MHQRKSKKIIIYFFLLFALGSINNIGLNKLKFYELNKNCGEDKQSLGA